MKNNGPKTHHFTFTHSLTTRLPRMAKTCNGTTNLIPLLPCRPRALGGGLSIYSLCLLFLVRHSGRTLGCPPPYFASNGCVQLGWGTLAHHDSYRILGTS